MEINQVVTIVVSNGTEYVGKFRDETTDGYIIGDPHIVAPQGDSLGFMPTVAMTGEPKIGEVKFQKSGIILVVKTAEAVEKEYRKASSGLIL
jgi:hypothetical protein